MTRTVAVPRVPEGLVLFLHLSDDFLIAIKLKVIIPTRLFQKSTLFCWILSLAVSYVAWQRHGSSSCTLH